MVIMGKLVLLWFILIVSFSITAQNPAPVGILRSRAIKPIAIETLRSSSLTLPLFEDVTLTVQHSYSESRPSGGYIWYGKIQDESFSSVVLVIDETILAGQITLPGKLYNLTAKNGGLTVEEIDIGFQHSLLKHAPVAVTSLSASTVPRSDSGQTIDLLVVYNQNAKAITGGSTADIEAAIESTVALTNTTFRDSGVNTQLNIVHMQEVFYLEQPNIDFGADLANLTGKTDGYMDEVHPLRDRYNADLVVLIAGTWFNTYCGTGWLPSPLNEAYGFSITEARCLSGYSFAHQIGHNMGSDHDGANASGTPIAPYAYGYQDLPTAPGDYADFVTIMALNTGGHCPPIQQNNVCPVIGRWSNPNQTYNGKPLGVTEAANNARSLNEAAVIVANYRTSNSQENNLLVNGNFEIDADADLIPDFWTPGNFGDKTGIVCNATVYQGNCALRLTAKSFIRQKVDGAGFIAGDTLTVRAYVRHKKSTPNGFIRLRVVYVDVPTSVLRIPIPAGNNHYTPLSGSLTLAGTAAKLKLDLRASGKLFFDSIRLTN